MGHRGTITLACLVLAGAGLWMFLARGARRSDGAERSASAPAIETEGARRPAVEPLASAAPEALPPERAPVAAEVAAPEDPARAAGSGKTLVLELVLAEQDMPAAFADVWYRLVDEGDELELDAIDGLRIEGSGEVSSGSVGGFRQIAKKARADELGLVDLPAEPGRFLRVLAEKDGHLGTRTIACDPGTGERERLELVRDGELLVRVLHASGEPAAKIRVFLRAQSAGSSWSTSSDTGPDGLARFAHTGLRAREHPGASWSTGVTLPISEPLERSFDPQEPPAEPVVLRLPQLGEVEVQVLEVDGSPAADGTQVWLGLVRPGEPRELSPFARHERAYAHERTHDGRALFRSVEPGFELEIRAGREWQSIERGFFPGPPRAGARAQHTLRIDLDHPVLDFRALDEGLQPLRDERLDLEQLSRSGWNTSRDQDQVRTDAEGRFHLDLPDGWKEGDRHELVVTAREGAIGAKLDLSRAFEKGRNAMGDLVLRQPPLLAAGRVIDASGEGVTGAEIRLESSYGEHGWDETDGGAKSAEAGAFAARGFVFGERLRLTPRLEGKSGASVECKPGERGIELVLVATGALAGAVLLDEGIPGDRLQLRLLPEGVEVDASDWDLGARAEPDASGRFRFEELLPGRYSLGVTLGYEQELAEIDALVVVPGETSRDPRLDPLDLRGRLFRFRLRFLPPEPDARLEGTLACRPAGTDGQEHWQHFRGNPAELLTPHASADVTCSIRGYRTVRLQDVRGERDVPLTRALRVRLVLPADVTLPVPPTYLKATLVADGENHGGIDFGASAFDETRESVSLVSASGRMRVQWLLERRTAGGASATTLELEPVQWVEVAESQEQRFELEVSRAALEKALAEAPF